MALVSSKSFKTASSILFTSNCLSNPDRIFASKGDNKVKEEEEEEEGLLPLLLLLLTASKGEGGVK